VIQLLPQLSSGILRCTAALGEAGFRALRTELILNHCKWDPQLSDRGTLAPFALLIGSSTWDYLRQTAERARTFTVSRKGSALRFSFYNRRLADLRGK